MDLTLMDLYSDGLYYQEGGEPLLESLMQRIKDLGLEVPVLKMPEETEWRDEAPPIALRWQGHVFTGDEIDDCLARIAAKKKAAIVRKREILVSLVSTISFPEYGVSVTTPGMDFLLPTV